MRVWADKLSAMREPSKREGRIRPFRDMPSRGYRSWPESVPRNLLRAADRPESTHCGPS